MLVAPAMLFEGKKQTLQAETKIGGKDTTIDIIITFTGEIPITEITPLLTQLMNEGLHGLLEDSGHVKNGRFYLKMEEIQGKKIYQNAISFDQFALDVAPGLMASITEAEFGLSIHLGWLFLIIYCF